MLVKKYRFLGPNSTRAVRKRGSSVRHGAFSLRYLPTDRNSSRVAVVVSKKVDKRAVVRNKIRRRIYEQVRSLWGNIAHPHDITIAVFSAEVLELTEAELRAEITRLFALASLLEK